LGVRVLFQEELIERVREVRAADDGLDAALTYGYFATADEIAEVPSVSWPGRCVPPWN
jgi:lincosamide nucleotidyltransferase B/F